MQYVSEVYQPNPDIWLLIALHLDEKSLMALGVCSSVFNVLIEDSLLRPFCLRDVATYSSLDDAVDKLAVDEGPLYLFRWSLYLEKHPELGMQGLASLACSYSTHHLALFVHAAREHACDYALLTKLALSADCSSHSLARYILGLHDWSERGLEIGKILVTKKYYDLLAFCYAQGMLPSRVVLDTYRPVKEMFPWSYKYTLVPMGYESGFYLASKYITSETVHNELFTPSLVYPTLKERIYFRVDLASKLVPDCIHRYRLHLTGKVITGRNARQVISMQREGLVLYFDSLSLVRGLIFFCLLMRIPQDEYIEGVYDNISGEKIQVTINAVYDNRLEKQLVTVE